MWTRRDLIKTGSAIGLAAAAGAPRIAFANAPTDKRLVVILQRGAQDGLHALPPLGDPAYQALRPRTAISAPGTEGGALKLTSDFGLHPALTALNELWAAKQMLAIPAIATRYRERSHFDGQSLLEGGTATPFGAKDGWLNRALAGFGTPDAKLGFAYGFTVPLILLGDAEVTTYSPSSLPSVDDDFLARLLNSYDGDEVFAEALEDGIAAMDGGAMSRQDARQANRNGNVTFAANKIAETLVKEDGPRVAVLESGGWDTHTALNNRGGALFRGLNDGIAALRSGLAPVWDKTLVITVTEFGRTAAENGAAGTDHGTGGTSFVFGGAVNGGKILGDWPGLAPSDLYENRDVAPRNTMEGALKAVLIQHLGLATAFVEDNVFPDSRGVRPIEGI